MADFVLSLWYKYRWGLISFGQYIFSLFFQRKQDDISSESSARQRIHMKNQALFSSKNKSKN